MDDPYSTAFEEVDKITKAVLKATNISLHKQALFQTIRNTLKGWDPLYFTEYEDGQAEVYAAIAALLRLADPLTLQSLQELISDLEA